MKKEINNIAVRVKNELEEKVIIKLFESLGFKAQCLKLESGAENYLSLVFGRDDGKEYEIIIRDKDVMTEAEKNASQSEEIEALKGEVHTLMDKCNQLTKQSRGE